MDVSLRGYAMSEQSVLSSFPNIGNETPRTCSNKLQQKDE